MYLIGAFGPGFVIGLLIANLMRGRGQPTYMDIHQQKTKQAAEHNAQWHPSQERWQKQF
jgi:hypothetical protein